MEVIVEGDGLSLNKNSDYKDKETGAITEGKYKFGMLIESEIANGSIRHEVLYITIPDSRVKEFEAQIGKKTKVKCNVISKGQISFYVK